VWSSKSLCFASRMLVACSRSLSDMTLLSYSRSDCPRPLPAQVPDQTASTSTAGAASASAIDQLRSTAKWLATALAAIAAVLLGGLQLSSIGKTGHLALAVIGGVSALVATGRALWLVTRVLTPVTVTLSELPGLIGDVVGRDRTLLKTQDRNLADLIAKYEAEYDTNVAAWEAAEKAPPSDGKR
jgi:hypothetical protein